MQSYSKLKITDLEADLALTLEEAENIVGGNGKRKIPPSCPGCSGTDPDLMSSSAIVDNPISFEVEVKQ